jgi:hypothetical protein
VGQIDRSVQRIRADATDRAGTKDLVRDDSDDDEINDRNRVVERLAEKQLPHDTRRRQRVGVHEQAKPGLGTRVLGFVSA